MKPILPRSSVEALAGSLATESALTLIAAIAGGPIAPLLPVLANSLAANRQQERVKKALQEINAVLTTHEAAIRSLTDEQYKLINESVLAILTTTQSEKILLLRNAIKNALSLDDIAPQDAVMVSRVIRDISVEEASFLARAFSYQAIELSDATQGEVLDTSVLRVPTASADALSVSGFVSLGLLAPSEAPWNGIGSMRFTRIATKVLALLRADA
jgi:hypothetical protein